MSVDPGPDVDCVVDASVGIKLFLVEPLSDRADALFARLVATPPARFYVPDLFFIECANILWKYTRRYGYPPGAVQQNVIDLARLPLQSASTADLAEEALALAMSHEFTACDAAYVALSRRSSLPLVTADEPLVHRLAGTGLDVRWLGAWPEPCELRTTKLGKEHEGRKSPSCLSCPFAPFVFQTVPSTPG
jgi:predicted nucleic acid-binding protein